MDLHQMVTQPQLGVFVTLQSDIDRLRRAMTATYVPLDPGMPAEEPYQARWRLRLNVDAEELRGLVST